MFEWWVSEEVRAAHRQAGSVFQNFFQISFYPYMYSTQRVHCARACLTQWYMNLEIQLNIILPHFYKF